LPIAKAGRGEHDEHGGGQDHVLVFLEEFRRFVAADLLVNFLKDVAHCGGALSQPQRESERAGGKAAGIAEAVRAQQSLLLRNMRRMLTSVRGWLWKPREGSMLAGRFNSLVALTFIGFVGMTGAAASAGPSSEFLLDGGAATPGLYNYASLSALPPTTQTAT